MAFSAAPRTLEEERRFTEAAREAFRLRRTGTLVDWEACRENGHDVIDMPHAITGSPGRQWACRTCGYGGGYSF